MTVRMHNFSGIPWYDHEKDKLLKTISWCFKHNIGPKHLPREADSTQKLADLLGIVSPHAGYSCSGPHASHGYLEISTHKGIESVIILGTNHTGMGSPTSLFPKGEWQTPLGSLEIDETLHDTFTHNVQELKTDIGFSIEPYAHLEEHSIDNQLPFLQYSIENDFKILPIAMGDHSLSTCLALANVISRIISSSNKKIIIVASSDFTHYLSPHEAEKRDQPVIKHLLDFDLDLAVKTKKSLNASICGFGPIVTLFAIAKEQKMTNCEVLTYGHSGQTCSSSSQVVAYSSMILGK